jgi:hypothetical protein
MITGLRLHSLNLIEYLALISEVRQRTVNADLILTHLSARSAK